MNGVLSFPPHIRTLLTIALSAVTFIFVLDFAIANVSIPYIAGDLAVSFNEGTYVITSFAIGNAIALPITGWLAQRLGRVKLLCLSILLFTFFSWSCGLAENLEMLIFSRFFQGLCAGPLLPLSQTLIIMIHPPEQKAKALALWSMIAVTGPVAGPVLGGWISYDYRWEWIFYINIPIGIACFGIIWSLLRQHDTKTEKMPTDFVSLILLAIGVCTLQFMLDKGEQYDWLNSKIITTCAVTALISFTFLIVWSLTTKKPLIHLRLFKIKTYAVSVFYIGVIFTLFFGSVVLVPLWLQMTMNYTAIWAGLAMAPIGFLPVLLGIFMAPILKRFGVTPPLFCCFLFCAASCFYISYFNTSVNFFHIALSRLLFGAGLLTFTTPLFALSTYNIAEEELANSTSLFHFVRVLAGSIGTSLFTTLWTRRSAFHHSMEGEALTSSAPQTQSYLSSLDHLGFSSGQAFEFLNNTLTIQSRMLGLADCFYLMGWIFLGLLILLPLTRRSKPKLILPPQPSSNFK